jgi:hypothetical protein
MLMLFLAIMTGVVFTPIVAWAVDGGELGTQFAVDFGLGRLRNPSVSYSSESEDSGTFGMRVSGLLDYAISDSWSIATGLRFTLPVTTTARSVVYRDLGPGDLPSSVWQMSLPLRITFQYSRGTGILWLTQFEGGVTWRHFEMGAMSREVRWSAHDVLYADSSTVWTTLPYARLGTACQWRYWDHFAMAMGPFYQTDFGHGWQAGLAVQVEYMTGAGPSWESWM